MPTNANTGAGTPPGNAADQPPYIETDNGDRLPILVKGPEVCAALARIGVDPATVNRIHSERIGWSNRTRGCVAVPGDILVDLTTNPTVTLTLVEQDGSGAAERLSLMVDGISTLHVSGSMARTEAGFVGSIALVHLTDAREVSHNVGPFVSLETDIASEQRLNESCDQTGTAVLHTFLSGPGWSRTEVGAAAEYDDERYRFVALGSVLEGSKQRLWDAFLRVAGYCIEVDTVPGQFSLRVVPPWTVLDEIGVAPGWQKWADGFADSADLAANTPRMTDWLDRARYISGGWSLPPLLTPEAVDAFKSLASFLDYTSPFWVSRPEGINYRARRATPVNGVGSLIENITYPNIGAYPVHVVLAPRCHHDDDPESFEEWAFDRFYHHHRHLFETVAYARRLRFKGVRWPHGLGASVTSVTVEQHPTLGWVTEWDAPLGPMHPSVNPCEQHREQMHPGTVFGAAGLRSSGQYHGGVEITPNLTNGIWVGIITAVHVGNYAATYDAQRIIDGVQFTDLQPWRVWEANPDPAPNLYYRRASVGDVCLIVGWYNGVQQTRMIALTEAFFVGPCGVQAAQAMQEAASADARLASILGV